MNLYEAYGSRLMITVRTVEICW